MVKDEEQVTRLPSLITCKTSLLPASITFTRHVCVLLPPSERFSVGVPSLEHETTRESVEFRVPASASYTPTYFRSRVSFLVSLNSDFGISAPFRVPDMEIEVLDLQSSVSARSEYE